MNNHGYNYEQVPPNQPPPAIAQAMAQLPQAGSSQWTDKIDFSRPPPQFFSNPGLYNFNRGRPPTLGPLRVNQENSTNQDGPEYFSRHPKRYKNSDYYGTNTPLWNNWNYRKPRYDSWQEQSDPRYSNQEQRYPVTYQGDDQSIDVSSTTSTATSENAGHKSGKRKKSLSQAVPTKKSWTSEEARMAIEVERECNKVFKNHSLRIRFPDQELNREIVSKFHSSIETVYFQQPSNPRFCYVTLADGADPNAIIEELNKIKFGLGYLSAEYKKDREDDQNVGPEDIDPSCLYVGNLAQDVTKEDMVNFFPKHKRIDIGFAKKMKYTRYAFVSFKNVQDAIEAFKATHYADLHSKSIIVRFRRLHGTVGMPGEPKIQNPSKDKQDTSKKVETPPSFAQPAPMLASAPPPFPSAPVSDPKPISQDEPKNEPSDSVTFDLSLVKNEPSDHFDQLQTIEDAPPEIPETVETKQGISGETEDVKPEVKWKTPFLPFIPTIGDVVPPKQIRFEELDGPIKTEVKTEVKRDENGLEPGETNEEDFRIYTDFDKILEMMDKRSSERNCRLDFY